MDSSRPLLIPLDAHGEWDERVVGGKAAKLAQLACADFEVPGGFCLTTWAYEAFISDAGIASTIRMELGRKSLEDMRWEELWDAALRIRAAFLAQPLSGLLRDILGEGLQGFDVSTPLAVRSSAIGEDSPGLSFAGLHESIIGVRGRCDVEDAVRLVWASLWSDAALLYRKELCLDPAHSRMAVLVQAMVDADRSGVAFARDPRDIHNGHAVIESVPGPCSLLVDGVVDPDHWVLDRKTQQIITWLPGRRDAAEPDAPLLEPTDLENILETLLAVEKLFGWSPDMEWTGISGSLTVLQARPITAAVTDDNEKRAWYLTLRPGDARLQVLRKRVTETLIPELEAEGQALAAEELALLDDQQLADAIERRDDVVGRWKQIYWDDFIPFAHGVRRLATYYNDSVQPEDPYEFVGLLLDQPLVATQRNEAIAQLARQLATSDGLRLAVERLLAATSGNLHWPTFRDELLRLVEGAEEFVDGFEDMNKRFLDIAYDQERLYDQPETMLRNLIELSRQPKQSHSDAPMSGYSVAVLEKRLLDAVDQQRHVEAIDVIETGRISWKLRDDDNLLVSRLESQLLRALDVASQRLVDSGRLNSKVRTNEEHVEPFVRALRLPLTGPVTLDVTAKVSAAEESCTPPGQTPRQLIGQPASPGVATARVHCINGHGDLGNFRQGQVLVCDAIQPTMTHLVLLASAIIERRGGMLIHGAIIARELGIPCVNGVHNAASILKNGDLVTVDGHLGIVTVGAAEFDLELAVDRE